MAATFALSHRSLAAHRRFTALAEFLEAHQRIDSAESFNQYCRAACRAWRQQFHENIGTTNDLFSDLLARIERHGPGTIPTSWGGVVVTVHQHPEVEKYLVIRAGGYLALEKHAEKDEHLEVHQGAGLILSRSHPEQPLAVEALLPERRFHFAPGMEHCLIGTEDLLVFERSTDPRGMDQDLIFLYQPDAA